MSKDIKKIVDELEVKIHAAARETRSHVPLEVGDAIDLVNQIRARERLLNEVKGLIETTHRNFGNFIKTYKDK